MWFQKWSCTFANIKPPTFTQFHENNIFVACGNENILLWIEEQNWNIYAFTTNDSCKYPVAQHAQVEITL